MKLLRWIVFALAALVLMLFAVSNRQSVTIALWPLPDRAELPLYLLVLGTLLIGFVVGELIAWTDGWRWRREARQSRDRIAALEHELAAERARPVVTTASTELVKP